MAPRAYWKGYLKLSLVSCPIALFPAASEREKISFHQLNKNTGHRIKYRKVDAETDLRLRARLEERGIPAARGGKWSAVQVSRLLEAALWPRLGR
jgi:DNA end-binding protein Ku